MADKPTDQPKRPRGRPSLYTPQLADEICARLSKGEPLSVICADEHMPAVNTVYDWQKAHETFSVNFARGRDTGYDTIAYRTRETARGVGESSGDVQRDKLIIDTDLKLLAKWDPKRYGEKVALTGGSAEDAPLKIENVSDETRAKAILAVLAKAQAKG